MDLLGKDSAGSLFARWVRRLDESVVVECEEDVGVFWNSCRAGVEMWVDRHTRLVTTVYLYGGKTREHQAYLGKMPFEISFSDVRDEVIRKVGEVPQHQGDLFDSWDFSWGRFVVRYGKDGAVMRVAATANPG